MYVLILTHWNGRYKAGAFVARPGSSGSYVYQLQNARTYPTREAAEADRCPGNERAVSLEEAMRR